MLNIALLCTLLHQDNEQEELGKNLVASSKRNAELSPRIVAHRLQKAPLRRTHLSASSMLSLWPELSHNDFGLPAGTARSHHARVQHNSLPVPAYKFLLTLTVRLVPSNHRLPFLFKSRAILRVYEVPQLFLFKGGRAILGVYEVPQFHL